MTGDEFKMWMARMGFTQMEASIWLSRSESVIESYRSGGTKDKMVMKTCGVLEIMRNG